MLIFLCFSTIFHTCKTFLFDTKHFIFLVYSIFLPCFFVFFNQILFYFPSLCIIKFHSSYILFNMFLFFLSNSTSRTTPIIHTFQQIIKPFFYTAIPSCNTIFLQHTFNAKRYKLTIYNSIKYRRL